MAEQIIPATLVGLAVVATELGAAVRVHLEAKAQDWENVEALVGIPGVTVLPEGGGVLLNPAAVAVVLKGDDAETRPGGEG